MSKGQLSKMLSRMIDDKGNTIKPMTIVTDTGKSTGKSSDRPEYWLVIDQDTCYQLIGKPHPVTLAKLKNDGYIKIYERVNRIARETL